jgi:hypothetical protein
VVPGVAKGMLTFGARCVAKGVLTCGTRCVAKGVLTCGTRRCKGLDKCCICEWPENLLRIT